MRGVTSLALTDHDTTRGLGEARAQAAIEGIELIAGIELSCLWQGMNIHVVGLNVDIESDALIHAEAHQLRAREERALSIADKLEKAGIANTYEGAKAIAGDAIVGRPHFARHLVERGAVKSQAVAFKKYLGAGKQGDVKQMWPGVGTVVEWIVNAGGVAVIAHPDKYKMTRTKLKRLVDDFCEAGGGAIEVVSGRQTPQVTSDMARIADQYELLASCGSDFHVPDQPWQELGSFLPLPEISIPVWTHWQK